jgi:mannose-1-phosphate guanylyltransferase
MKILLLSGGAGRRLWPLSNKVRSKQFLKLLSTKDTKCESMLQRMCRQLDEAGLLSMTSIITSQNQEELIRNQLESQNSIICEPRPKGTFSAISLAISYLYSNHEKEWDDAVCVLPVDAFVDKSFFHLIRKIPEILKKSHSELIHIGVHPKFPSDQFGYIVPETTKINKEYFPIRSFIEKPARSKAVELIKNKALWNCGVYGFSMKFMLEVMREKGLPFEFDQFLAAYQDLPKLSFDVAVAEHCKRSIVMPFQGQWQDIGTWSAFSEQLISPIWGAGKLSNDSVNTHIINELPQPVHVIGISDSMIVAGPDGILVADKNKSSEIKGQITDEHFRYAEKRWGSYKVLEMSSTDDVFQSITKVVNVLPNRNSSYHYHQHKKEIWTIISGSGEVIVNNKLQFIKAGEVLQIQRGVKHAVKAVTPLKFVEVQIGDNISEKDITRITYSWEEAIQQCE